MSPLSPVAVLLVLATAAVFIATTDGKDIRVKLPPPRKCPPNAHLSDCGSPCDPSCENISLLYPHKACPLICMMNACVCDKGFYKTKDGACVRAEDCV